MDKLFAIHLNNEFMEGKSMEQYRLYKKINGTWEKTSYVGDRILMIQIMANLSESKTEFVMRKEE